MWISVLCLMEFMFNIFLFSVHFFSVGMIGKVDTNIPGNDSSRERVISVFFLTTLLQGSIESPSMVFLFFRDSFNRGWIECLMTKKCDKGNDLLGHMLMRKKDYFNGFGGEKKTFNLIKPFTEISAEKQQQVEYRINLHP